MDVTIEFTGTTPLLHHDIALSDPANEWARLISEVASKRKKTPEDHALISQYEWFGGLIVAPGIVEGPAWKTASIRKCLIEAAKITKEGKTVGRALAFTDMFVPLEYDGPRDIKKLFDSGEYTNRASVKVGMARVMRTRPEFKKWKVRVNAILLEDVMDLRSLTRIVELAGRAEGLGDNRTNGYGRFIGEVKSNGK